MSEKEKFNELIQKKISAGLRDVKFYSKNTDSASEEEFYAELNRLYAAPDLPDLELI